MPSRRAALAVWTAALCVSVPAAQAATQTAVALEYEIGSDVSGCPSVEDFRASVERQLRYDPFIATAERRVAVQIVRKENGYDGRIRWSDAGGRWVGDRRLSSKHADCEPISASLAFAVAVQIQLLATLAAPEPPAASAPPPAPPPNAPVVSREAGGVTIATVGQPPGPPAASRWAQLSAGFGPSLALGLAPRPTGVGRLFASGRRGALSLEFGLEAALPVSERRIDVGGFSLDRFAAAGAFCGHLRMFAACVTGTVGLLRARGFAVDQPASPAGAFFQVGGRLVATRDLGRRFFLAGRIDLLVVPSRWTVRLNDAAVWTTPRVGALAGLDVGARFF